MFIVEIVTNFPKSKSVANSGLSKVGLLERLYAFSLLSMSLTEITNKVIDPSQKVQIMARIKLLEEALV